MLAVGTGGRREYLDRPVSRNVPGERWFERDSRVKEDEVVHEEQHEPREHCVFVHLGCENTHDKEPEKYEADRAEGADEKNLKKGKIGLYAQDAAQDRAGEGFSAFEVESQAKE